MERNLNFLDDIENYDSPDSCDKSVTGSSTKSNSDGSENKLNEKCGKQMVMVDQN